ncbi:hypothetical protein QJQ45_019183 [Haematococcus lacustris]|nr:hypothetical protein QJQ45_019183 [Haematococcus lacustris]
MATIDVAVKLAPRSLVVSLDLGTYGSGYAFKTMGSSGQVRMHEDWPDSPEGLKGPKTRSAILYKGSPADQASGNYTMLTNFKLTLQDKRHAAKLPAGLSPEQVIADYLTFLRKYVLEQLAREVGAAMARLENIQWCLTVPAIWSEGSKALMRTAAVRAGLIRTADSEALTIILEPEAAALHALEHQAPPLVPGMSVMVLDVGGGTADVTVHNCEERGGRCVLAESTRAMGGLCGSVFVDNNLRELYREAVGAAAFDAWSAQYPASLQQVMEKWEAVKQSFGTGASSSLSAAPDLAPAGPVPGLGFDDEEEEAAAGGAGGFRVFIPPDLHGCMTDDDLANLVVEQGSDTDVLLSCHTMSLLFEQPVQEICALAVSQLEAAAQEEGTGPCSMVLLVGGFARSAYLQARVRAALMPTGLAMDLVVPPNPHAAVLEGMSVWARNEDGMPNKQWVQENGDYYCNSVFQPFVKKNQKVEWNEVVVHFCSPLNSNQAKARIMLYATDNIDTRYVEDSDTSMRAMAELELPLLTQPAPSTAPSAADTGEDGHKIAVSLLFGRTTITASACDQDTLQEVQLVGNGLLADLRPSQLTHAPSMAPIIGRKAPKAATKKKALVFVIDCSKPVDDKIMEIGSFEKFLVDKIKVNNKTGVLGEAIKVSRDKSKVTVTAETHISKRYLKYLTKKYLKKHNVRDWLRVIASNKDRNVYELRYFNIADNEADDDE